MAIVSIQRIINTQDRTVLDMEYRNIISNLKLGSIESDNEIIELYQELMNVISGKVLGYEAAEILRENYDRWEKQAIEETLTSANAGIDAADLVNPLNATVKITAGLAMSCASQYFVYQDRASELRRELSQDLWRITEEERTSYNALQTKLLNSSWKLLRQYNLPDEYRIVQKSVDDLFSAVNEADTGKRLAMLQALEHEFRIYPPYWVYRARSAQKAGKDSEAAKCFDEFDKVWRSVLRNDPYKVEAEKFRVQAAMNSGDKQEALSHLALMAENTPRSDWANNLFEGVAYFLLGDHERGKRQIELNINFGNGRDISNVVMKRMNEGKLDLASLPYELKLLIHDDINTLSYEDLKALASYGRPDAQSALGVAKTFGKIVISIPQDYNDAAEWFKKAAYEGYKPAQLMLAALYLEGGANFPKDYRQAYVWYYVYGFRSMDEEYGFFSRMWQRFYRNVCSVGGLMFDFYSWLEVIEGEGLFNFGKLSENEIHEARAEAQRIIAEIERRIQQRQQ